MTDVNVGEQILYYKRYLEKYLEKGPDEIKILHVLKKLRKLPVTLDHLQETGIGKTVNSYRKHEGNIGPKAKELINQWKSLVPQEENGQDSSQNDHQGTQDDLAQVREEETSEQCIQADTPSDVKDHNATNKSYREEKCESGRDKTASSNCDREASCDKQLSSGDKHLSSRDKQSSSKEKYSSSKDRQSSSKDKYSSSSKDRHSLSKDKLHSSSKEEKSRPLKNSSSNSRSEHGDRNDKKHPRSDRHDKTTSDQRSKSPEGRSKSTHKSDKPQSNLDSKQRYDLEKPTAEDTKDSNHHSVSNQDSAKDLSDSDADRLEDNHLLSLNAKINSFRAQLNHNFDIFADEGKDKDSDQMDWEIFDKSDKKKSREMDDNRAPRKVQEAETKITRGGPSGVRDSSGGPSHERGRKSVKFAGEESQPSDADSQEENNGVSFADVLLGLAPVVPTKKKSAQKVKESSGSSSSKEKKKVVLADDMATSSKVASSSKDKNSSGGHAKGSSSKHSSGHSKESSKHSSSGHHAKESSKHSHGHSKELSKHSTGGSTKESSKHSSGGHAKESSRHSSGHSRESSKDSSGRSKESSKHSTKESSKPSTSHKSHDSKHHSMEPSKHSSSKHSSSSSRKDKSDGSGRKDEKPASGSGDSENRKRKSETPIDIPRPSKEMKLSTSDIVGILPQITPNYKPLPHLPLDFTSPPRKAHGDLDETLVATKKQGRTMVYSGKKTVTLTVVPRLFDACMRVLMDNIDAIDFVGNAPYMYDILKPLLMRCTATQLYNIEEANPMFVGQSDSLWEKICDKEFRGAQRCEDDFETWRELYLRKSDERDAKLKKLTSNISKSMQKAGPAVKKTRLAYVDVPAKAPRDVRRRQQQHGTAGPSKVDHLAKLTSHKDVNMPKAPRVSVPKPETPPKRVKSVAPMMMKSLKLMKNLHRK